MARLKPCPFESEMAREQQLLCEDRKKQGQREEQLQIPPLRCGMEKLNKLLQWKNKLLQWN